MESNEIENRKTIEEINEPKSWFLEKINKTDKALARLMREKEQIINIRNKRSIISIDSEDIKRIKRE